MSESQVFPCSKCGAPLMFQPGQGKLVCPFCGTENAIPGSGRAVSPWGTRTGADTGVTERDFEEALRTLAAAPETEETATLSCPGCGAEVTLDATTLAEECPFCGTPLARAVKGLRRHPKPQAILPFALDQRAARERMTRWLGSLWFAPSKLKRFARASRPLAGVYLPHYTYDADGEADYTGQRGDAYYVTRTRMVNGKMQSFQERHIRWHPVAGRVRHLFDDVLVPATASRGAGAAEYGGRSWDLAALEAYRSEYMAGFRAEVPTIGIDEGFVRAQAVMEQVLQQEVRADIGGDEQRIGSMTERFSDITFKHVLLPVWLASYRWQGKIYQVAVNGRTGEVTGDRPYSPWKIAFAILLALIAAAIIGYVVMLNQGR